MCHGSEFHGSRVARGYDFHRLCPNNPLLQRRHDRAGAWQHSFDGCGVTSRQFSRTLFLPVADPDVYCK